MEEENSATLDQSKDESDQEIVTLEEFLDTQQQLMDETHAVLGAIDDKKCTYDEGYMKRQALYSCLTCIPEARTDFSKSGGLCLGCSYYCHDGHELIELYTKRNFCCDCGNDKFSSTCTLNNCKDRMNEENIYNQNFSGVYCICKRPYPDPEDPIQDEMIQCIICEDWYHSRHLNVEIPPGSSYTEMTCGSCVEKHEFLLDYEGLCVTKVAQEDSDMKAETSQGGPSSLVKIEEANTSEIEPSSNTVVNGTVPECDEANKETKCDDIKVEDKSEAKSSDTAISITVPDTETKNEDIKGDCKRPKTKSRKISTLFWIDVDWRKNLCSCLECKKMYEEQKVLFLLDSQDTVPLYEERGKAKARETEAKRETEFINSLARVPLLEAIAGFNDMKDNLSDFLKKFAENKKIVREEDIKEFFSKYDPKKRQRCDVPYNCR